MAMNHGNERNRRVETVYRDVAGFANGMPIELGHGGTLTVSERWCATCQTWIEVRGVMGGISFEFEHAEGHAR